MERKMEGMEQEMEAVKKQLEQVKEKGTDTQGRMIKADGIMDNSVHSTWKS